MMIRSEMQELACTIVVLIVYCTIVVQCQSTVGEYLGPDGQACTASCTDNFRHQMQDVLQAFQQQRYETQQLKEQVDRLKSDLFVMKTEVVRRQRAMQADLSSIKTAVHGRQRRLNGVKNDISDIKTQVQQSSQTLANDISQVKQKIQQGHESLKSELTNLKVSLLQDHRTTKDQLLSSVQTMIKDVQNGLEDTLTNVSDHIHAALEQQHNLITNISQYTWTRGGRDGDAHQSGPDDKISPGYTRVTHARDCEDIRQAGRRTNGTYLIQPQNLTQPFSVYCEMYSDHAWTVIQRRQDGKVDFYRTWAEYRDGFGEVSGEHWLGNSKIHKLTTQGIYKLGIEMWDWRVKNGVLGKRYYAEANSFYIEDEPGLFRLHVPKGYYAYSGFGGSGLRVHRGPFCTHDRNNVYGSENCAVTFHCGWWFTSCVTNANLNGRYYHGGYADVGTKRRARDDLHWPNVSQSLRKVVMKIRRVITRNV